MTTDDLFNGEYVEQGAHEHYFQQVHVFRGLALSDADVLIDYLKNTVLKTSPFRYMLTPGGRKMSVSITNCGQVGWVSDVQGYRYAKYDPYSKLSWPDLPQCLINLSIKAAEMAGFNGFNPDSCIINKYAVASKMSLHQDKDEHDFQQPIVSISLGIAAVFEMGGFTRGDSTLRIPLFHGDVVVWGGEDRLRFHGVLPIKADSHPITKQTRINFTVRQAL